MLLPHSIVVQPGQLGVENQARDRTVSESETMKTQPKYEAVASTIDNDQIKYADLLRATADQMIRLSNELSDTGKPLSSKDQELVRMAALPWLRDSFQEITVEFLAGQNPTDGAAFNDMVRILNQLTR